MTSIKELWPEIQRRHLDETNALIAAAIRETGGNISATARLLQVQRKTILRRVDDHGLNVQRRQK